MPPSLDWTDPRALAIALVEAHPEVQPLEVRFTDLHAWILALPGFVGAADASNEKILEAVQMTWLDEVED